MIVAGSNESGQIGLGDKASALNFTLLMGPEEEVKDIYCGSNFSFFYKKSSQLWASGGSKSFNDLFLSNFSICRFHFGETENHCYQLVMRT